MRNRSKQRVCRGKGGPDRLKDEPHLSGAYIRSLVKQLTSYRNHTSDGGGVCSAKKGTVPGLQSNGLGQETNTSFLENEELFSETKNSRSQTHSDCNLLGLNSFPNMNDMQENAVSGGNKVSSSSYKGGGAVVNAPRTKKQVRKRVHTTRPYQERLLDMAEARREIVAALRFHRASMGESTSTTTKQSAVIPSKPEPIKYKRTTKLHQANNRCHSCILKEGIHKPNEAIAVTSCSHLLCWACLEELLNFSSGATSGCAACSKALRSCDVVPLRAPHALLQCNTEFQQPSIVHSHGEVPPLSSFSHETSTIQEDVGLPTAGKFTQTNNSLANHSTSIFYNSPPPPWSINTSEHSLPPLDLSWPSQLQQDPTLTLDPFSRCVSSWQTMVSSNSCSSPGMDLTVHHEHPSMHVAMDDEKLAEIRSIGDQHEMEWNDTVNLVNSAWLSAFELPECQMKPYHYQVVELPGSSDVLSALALPSDGLWQDDSLVIHSYDWEQLDQKRSEGIEFGDNTSVMSEPSINTESLARPPQTHHIEETWDDTDMHSLDVPK